jgi:hypothetical protein
VPAHQGHAQRGARGPSRTSDGCLRHDRWAYGPQTVPPTDGNGGSSPSPGCPRPDAPRMHQSAAGITGRSAAVWPCMSPGSQPTSRLPMNTAHAQPCMAGWELSARLKTFRMLLVFEYLDLG